MSICKLNNEIVPFYNGIESGDSLHINKLWTIHQAINRLRDTMSNQKLNVAPLDRLSDDSSEDTTVLPPTYIVIRIASDIKENTLLWLLEKIKGRRRDGGAELIVMLQPGDPEDGLVLHVSISKIKLLEAAEEMEIVKADRNGVMREFIVAQLEDFLPDDSTVDDLFTIAEKQTIVRHELENIRALEEDDHVPGYPACALYEGQSILQVCLSHQIIAKIYPLHDHEALKKLGRSWYYSLFGKQPFEDIRLYFGEAIALYFTFLDFYTSALLVPVFFGILQLLISSETMPFFCIFNVVWLSVMLEVWKRKSNELAYKWGTIGMTSLDRPRPNFRGSMGYDAVTGKLEPQAPPYDTYIKMYCVSIPIVFLCMVAAFIMMLVSFWLEDYAKTLYPADSLMLNIPSVIYTILVSIVNVYYRQLATYLTEWENHRTQSQYERHRVTKLVLFEFVNSFMSLFYIAFIMKDMDMLRSQLKTMLIVTQTITNLQEPILPLASKFCTIKMSEWRKFFNSPTTNRSRKRQFDDFTNTIADLKSIPKLPADDSRVEAANQEGDMEEYEGTYDDYLELFIQFGYVFLFSSVFPIAAFLAVVNNVLEIRADAFKLCKIFQRPMNKRVKDIGAWQRCFEILNAMSIMTNCGLLYLSPKVRSLAPNLQEIEWVLLFVFMEHFLLGIRYLLHIAISDKPQWVRVALARKNYESKQAVKFERAQKNRRLLTRKFKTVHGSHAQ